MRVYVLEYTQYFDYCFGKYGEGVKQETRRINYFKEESGRLLNDYTRMTVKDDIYYSDVKIYVGDVKKLVNYEIKLLKERLGE